MTPPDDCMIESGAPPSPISSSPVRIRSMYDDISGRTYALTTVVARPLVLALLAQDLARERDRRLRQRLGQDRAGPLLVLGVEVRVEEADRDRADAELAQPGGDRPHVPFVERLHDRPVRSHALRHLEAEAALDERRRLAPEEVVHVRDPQPPQLEHVTEVPGRDERRLGPETLDDRVRRDRRAVHDLGDGAGYARFHSGRRPIRRPRGRSSAASRGACAPARGRRPRGGSRR